jgi:hypothetical protein
VPIRDGTFCRSHRERAAGALILRKGLRKNGYERVVCLDRTKRRFPSKGLRPTQLTGTADAASHTRRPQDDAFDGVSAEQARNDSRYLLVPEEHVASRPRRPPQ